MGKTMLVNLNEVFVETDGIRYILPFEETEEYTTYYEKYCVEHPRNSPPLARICEIVYNDGESVFTNTFAADASKIINRIRKK